MSGEVFRTIGSLDLVSQDLMSDEGDQDHWFPGIVVLGPDDSYGFSGPFVPWI